MVEFTTFISSITALTQIAKGLQSFRDQQQIAQATSDLLERILAIQGDGLSLQQQYFSLLQEKDIVEKKLQEFEKWQTIESQYSLFRTEFGKIVYSPNESNKSSEPKHWLCANCFSKREKSILQPRHEGMQFMFVCYNCKTNLIVHPEEFQVYMT